MDKPSMLKPALIAGTLFGVAAGLPYLRMLNVCTCCLMVVLCGFLAAYVYSRLCRSVGTDFAVGSGALVGLVAGAFYAVVVSVVSTVATVAVGQPDVRGLLEFVQQIPEIPPESADMIDDALAQLDEESRFSAGSAITGFFMSVLIGAAFSTIGGLIDGAVFKTAAAAAPPPAPPAGSGGGVPPAGTGV